MAPTTNTPPLSCRGSWDTSSSHAKNRNIGRRCPVTWSRIVPRGIRRNAPRSRLLGSLSRAHPLGLGRLAEQHPDCRQRLLILQVPYSAHVKAARGHGNVRQCLNQPPLRTQTAQFVERRQEFPLSFVPVSS